VIPPQTAMALYIYRVGRSCSARKPFTSRYSLGFLNSTWTRGPPVGPVRPTGQTGVAVARLATGRLTGQTAQGHRSDRWRQPDRLSANFGCEQMSTPRSLPPQSPQGSMGTGGICRPTEVQDGGLQGYDDADEYDYSS
jgi:hypothetical protein